MLTLPQKILYRLLSWTTMWFFGGGGSVSGSTTKSSSKSDYWTKGQHKVEKNIGGWIGKHDFSKGAQRYGGQLSGTYTPESLKTMFAGADAYARGDMQGGPWKGAAPEGSQLFQHYAQYSDPERREGMIKDRLAARREMLSPERERADSEMKAKMRAMGMEYSSDMIKKQMDVENVRQAEEGLIASDLRDRYEQLGFQASEAALNTLNSIGSMQYEIKNRELQAEFDEWIRTQPEYSPMLDIAMKYLGLQGVSSTEGKSSTLSWSASAQGGYSDERLKKNIVELTPYSFEYKEGLGLPEGRHVGVMAQDLLKVRPRLVLQGEKGLMVDYAGLAVELLLELKRRS